MPIATVKWFSVQKGYGFLRDEENPNSPDIFVHIRALEKSGLSSLTQGDRVRYDLVMHRGRESAGNLQLLT